MPETEKAIQGRMAFPYFEFVLGPVAAGPREIKRR